MSTEAAEVVKGWPKIRGEKPWVSEHVWKILPDSEKHIFGSPQSHQLRGRDFLLPSHCPIFNCTLHVEARLEGKTRGARRFLTIQLRFVWSVGSSFS